MTVLRPSWAMTSDLMREYYDKLWGFPEHDDRMLFEMLCLECFQAGLSWEIIWKRRETFEAAFDNFDFNQMAKYDERDLVRLFTDKSIIRNRRKISAVIQNARAVQALAERGIGFAQYMWGFVDGEIQVVEMAPGEKLPPYTDLSKKISQQMKKDGFAFTGPTTVYSFMTAVGMVNARL
ncbi:MAG: DNA-3-methyladenine glycosylase I [Limosilactobacillus sp.]|uniref:DNA-3-methyladenine glycosylase I n=1 Tax=Limosilactobacillus sp. TaxID=2773925 RepID=UPI00270BFEFF|nr:DNA-3-methyladenine glycosylase I [Limosilactobacillus sp.]